MEVRVLKPGSQVSEVVYTTTGETDRKNIVTLTAPDGSQLRVHKGRLLPPDSIGKAIAIWQNGKLRGICPTCSRVLEVKEDSAKAEKATTIDCPIHGTKTITMHEFVANKTSAPRKEPTMAKTTPAESNFTLDMASVKKVGELWTKSQVKFSSACIDVQAHALLTDDPLRKLCFNTYDAKLGKGVSPDTLQLEAFKTNQNVTREGAVVYALKGTIDDARKRLQKAGYKKQ
jgi:hypothetical protein